MHSQFLSDRYGGIRFDPRTKLSLLLTASVFIMGGCGGSLPQVMYGVLCAIPFVLIYSTGQRLKAVIMLVFYAGITIIPGTNVFFVMIKQILLRFMPCILMGSYAVSTTTVSEFIAGMQRMHMPDRITIPMSVMFRLFPTIREEFVSIGNAMKLRGIGFWENDPSEVIEYGMIPFLMCSVRIGDELSASALSRGLDAGTKRTNICRIGFAVQDFAALGFCLSCFVFLISEAL